MTAAADTLYLPVLAPAKIRVLDMGLQQQRSAPQPKLQLQHQRPRLYRIPSRHVMKGMTYSPDGSVDIERTTGKLIDIFA